METHEHEALLKRVKTLEDDFNFAAGKCKEGLHAVVPVVRERIAQTPDPADPDGTVVVREFFLSCPHCDQLFGLQTDILGGIHVFEMEVDREKLQEVRAGIFLPEDSGEVIETELLDDDEFELDPGDDDEPEDGGGLHRF